LSDFSEFIIDYQLGDEQWSFSILAKSKEDALARLKSIKNNGIIFGRAKAV